MSKIWWVILTSTVILKLVLSSISFHYDLQHFAMSGWLVSQGHIFDLYDFISTLGKDDLLVKTNPLFPFNYPPVIYLFHGIFNMLFLPLQDPKLNYEFITNPGSTLSFTATKVHLLLLKLPYLFFDIPAGFLLASLFENKRQKLLTFLLWSFNPLVIYATYLVGQFDIIPTFFVIWSLVLAKKNKLNWSALSLGMGAAFKIYPLFLVIPLAVLEKSWIARLKLIFIALLPYILENLLFINSHGFRTSALLAGQSLKSLYAVLPISGGESILIFPTILIFIYLMFWFRSSVIEILWQKFFVVLLLFFIFTHTHPQWFMWLVPFFIIDLIRSEFKNYLLVKLSILSWLVLLFFFDPSLTMSIFSPIDPRLFISPSLWELLKLNPDINLMRSIFQTLFVGVAFYWIHTYFTYKDV